MPIKAIVFDAYGTLYDVQSVDRVIDAAYPGYGASIAKVWRLKQLEYAWLRSMMGRYEDFRRVTIDALAYTLKALGLHANDDLLDRVVEQYNKLDLYSDVRSTLESLSNYPLAILSNGSPDMLQALVSNSGMQPLIATVISVDSKRTYKPDPRAYELVEERLGLASNEVLFVSSNGFDIAGAKCFGFTVVQIQRVSSRALQAEPTDVASLDLSTVFKTLRAQTENIGFPPDFVIDAMNDLSDLMVELGPPTNATPPAPEPA